MQSQLAISPFATTRLNLRSNKICREFMWKSGKWEELLRSRVADSVRISGCLLALRVFVTEGDLTDHKLIWKVKVRVMRDSGVLTSKNGKTLYKRSSLIDEKGTTMQASIFGEDIKLFEDTLHQGRSYYVSRGIITRIKQQFRSGFASEHEYQMVIKTYTEIEEAKHSEGNQAIIPIEEFKFLPLMDLCMLPNEGQQIGVETRKRKADFMDISFREITITDSSLRPVTLSAWGHFVSEECARLCELLLSMPIIIAMNLRLKDIYGRKQLSTSATTDILINVDRPEVTESETWKLANKSSLAQLSQEKSVVGSIEQVVTVEYLKHSTNLEALFCVKAAIVNVWPKRRSWYMACNNCWRTTEKFHKSIFSCNLCHKQNVTAEPCSRLTVEIADSTGVVASVLFGKQAETFSKCSAETIMNFTEKEHLDFLVRVMGECVDKLYMFSAKVLRTEVDECVRITAVRKVD